MTAGGRPRKDRSGSTPGTRVCVRCDQELPEERFHKDSSRHDGLTTWCKTCRNANSMRWNAANGDRRTVADRTYKRTNAEELLERNRRARRKRRAEVIARYGGKCACCGEDHLEFLAIDHVNGGGTAHRREVGKGDVFYKWLKAAGYPTEGYRVLCHNCNLSLGFYGYCPHQP